MKKIRASFFIYAAIAFLPTTVKRLIYNRLLGHDIHETARIGLSYVQAGKITMGPHARIRNFNVIRNLEKLEIGEGATIGSHNRVNALPLASRKHFLEEADRLPALILGKQAAITGKHVFDCNNTITIGDFTTIAGQNSIFYTHGINIDLCRQESGKIVIGSYCMVAARCVVIKGAALPDYSVLAANSTLHKAFTQPYMLYSGVPAKPVRELDPAGQYFHRQTGSVS